MRRRNHYTVLGLTPKATNEEIRRAYLERVRRLHPDSGGAGASHEAFVELQQAYDCLAEPEARQRYDREHRTAPVAHPSLHDILSSEAMRSRGRFWDDLVAGEPWDSLSRVFPGLGARRTEKFGPNADLAVEVRVTPEEARRGTQRTVQVPVARVCLDCGGRGVDFAGRCPGCLGTGQIRAFRPFVVRIPAGSREGASFRTAVAAAPGQAVDLELRIRIDDD